MSIITQGPHGAYMDISLRDFSWVIWKKRDRIIFNRESFDEERCFEMWHFKLTWWNKVEWGEQVPSVEDIIHNPDCVEVPRG